MKSRNKTRKELYERKGRKKNKEANGDLANDLGIVDDFHYYFGEGMQHCNSRDEWISEVDGPYTATHFLPFYN